MEYENLHSQPITRERVKRQDIDIDKLIDEALPPNVWKDHLVKDLMKFWDTQEATDLEGGLFLSGHGAFCSLRRFA